MKLKHLLSLTVLLCLSVTVSYSNSDVTKETHQQYVLKVTDAIDISIPVVAVIEYSPLVQSSEEVGCYDVVGIIMAERSAVGLIDIKAPPKRVSSKLETTKAAESLLKTIASDLGERCLSS